ncbi:hypothetical protein [Amycolatopsis sp. NPDC051128]|uniref:hypothetical protein n=1 Tax=Amycolatopsis sp. NPDC051128 TaxID=3155412 RepID=UPI00341A5196
MLVAGATVLSVAVVARIGRFGFNPSDQGFVLAASWRILHGEIPHVDVVSPRPLGSAYLHVLDFVVPAPLMVASSFVMMAQLSVATIALAALLTGASPLRWGPLRMALVAAAVLVNLNTYPVMAWHTVDGVFLAAVGWWALDHGLRDHPRWARWLGLFCLGFAVIVKQSFAVTVPLGILILTLHPAARAAGFRWGRFVVDLLWLGAAPLLYFGMVTIGGGLPEALTQLTGGTHTWGENIYQLWTSTFADGSVDPRGYIIAAALGGMLLAGAWVFRQRLGRASGRLRVLAALATAGVTIGVVVAGRFEHASYWSFAVLWIFLVTAVLDAIVRRQFPWQQLLVVTLAWMSTLSWGYPIPSLLAGTMVLGTLDLLVRAVADLRAPRVPVPQVLGALAGVVALVAAGLQLERAHDRAPYADLPHWELTAHLGAAAPAMRGVRSNPSVGLYLTQIRDCLARYPASNVAVLPDSPFVYPVFKLHNPFPMDWPLPMEMVDDGKQRMIDTARRLDRQGDYLVLFQAVTAEGLAKGQPLPTYVPPEISTAGHSDVEPRIRAALTGQKISCGSLAGVWSPATG